MAKKRFTPAIKLKKFDKVYNPLTRTNEIVTRVDHSSGWVDLWLMDETTGNNRRALYGGNKMFSEPRNYVLKIERLT